jgi:GTP-binding protein HflX
VHVVDASNPQALQQVESVEKILLDLKLNEIRQIVVLNKADLLDESSLEALSRQIELDKDRESVAISAIQPQTLKPLIEKIGETIKVSMSEFETSEPDSDVLSKSAQIEI